MQYTANLCLENYGDKDGLAQVRTNVGIAVGVG